MAMTALYEWNISTDLSLILRLFIVSPSCATVWSAMIFFHRRILSGGGRRVVISGRRRLRWLRRRSAEAAYVRNRRQEQ